MSPLSAIPPTLPAQGLVPAADLPRPAATPTPGIEEPSPLALPDGVTPAQPAGDSFGHLLGQMIDDVNSRQMAANDAIQSMQAGGPVSLHQAVIAMEEANVSFQLMVEVRNKLLDAYQEIMRMQV